MEEHGKTSGMNQEDALKTIPIEKRLIKDVNRFYFVHAHLGCEDLGPLMNIVNVASMGAVTPSCAVALDEATYHYQPSVQVMNELEKVGDPIPKLFISRKPNPNAFLSNLVTTIMNGSELPYVLIADPFFKFPQKSPVEVVRDAIELLKKHYPKSSFCIVADSHYDSKEVFELFEKNTEHFKYCIGLVSCRHDDMFEVLKKGLGWGEWRACKDATGAIHSIKLERDVANTAVHHFCVSNYLTEVQPIQVVNSSVVGQGVSVPTSDSEETVYSRENLMNKKKKELEILCRKLGLRRNGNKEKITSRILDKLSRPTEVNDVFVQSISDFHTKVAPNVNLFYKKNFNGVDRSDGYWNQYDYNFKMGDWRSKLLYSVLKHSFLNAFVLINSFETMDHKTFHREIANILIDMSFEK